MAGQKNPSVTVGIPFYNAEGTLGNAIRSVFAQTLKDWELILIDDGSKDRSAAIAHSVRDSRVRVVTDGQHLTLAPRLNEIARRASAPYLARMDADDLMHPNRLERQVEFLKVNNQVDVIGGGICSVDSSLRPTGKRGLSFHIPSRISVIKKGIFVHPTVMGRTSWFLKNLYSEEDYAIRIEDYELWIRTCNTTTFGHIQEVLLFHQEDERKSLVNLLNSHNRNFHLFRRRKELGLGLWDSGIAHVIQLAKVVANRAAIIVGHEKGLISRRNIPITEEEARLFMNIINKTLATRVPGLEL